MTMYTSERGSYHFFKKAPVRTDVQQEHFLEVAVGKGPHEHS